MVMLLGYITTSKNFQKCFIFVLESYCYLVYKLLYNEQWQVPLILCLNYKCTYVLNNILIINIYNMIGYTTRILNWLMTLCLLIFIPYIWSQQYAPDLKPLNLLHALECVWSGALPTKTIPRSIWTEDKALKVI